MPNSPLSPQIITFILNLVEQSEVVFWVRTPEYDQQLYVSPAYETVWGRSCESLYQNPGQWAETLYPEDLERLVTSVRNRKPDIQPGVYFTETYRINKPNGDICWIKDKSVPIYDALGKHIGFAGIAQDITAEKAADQLRLDQKILKEQEEITRLLAASMAHELRTPLRAIESSSEGIVKILPQLLKSYQMAQDAGLEVPYIAPMQSKALANMAQNIKAEARSAFSVIDMLLVKTSLSHIDTHKFEPCSMAHSVDETLARYPLHPQERETIHWKKSDFSFLGNELLMIHVIFNLLKNALHYLKAAGKGEIQIWCEQNEKFNILHFKDTSLGIDPDILPHIFDKFYTRTHHGTGVGLAFCQLVMQSFGGTITCVSVKGEYTDFILNFPKLL